MKDYYIDLANLEVGFTSFLQCLLEEEGYLLVAADEHPGPGSVRSGPDLIMESPDGVTVIVEFKLYRAAVAPSALIEQASEKLRVLQRATKAQTAILVITVPLNDRQRTRFETPGTKIWDLDVLTQIVNKHPQLASEFSNLMRAAQVGTLGPQIVPSKITDLLDDVPTSSPSEGAALAIKLETSASGNRNKTAQIFEGLCLDALQLLFGQNFAGWKKQAPVERGYHRLDVIARLVPSTPFWSTLAGDFRARYVVFEFRIIARPSTRMRFSQKRNISSARLCDLSRL